MANLPKQLELKPLGRQNGSKPASRAPDGSAGPVCRRDVRLGPLAELAARTVYPEAAVVAVGVVVAVVVGCATALSGRGAPSGTAGSRMS